MNTNKAMCNQKKRGNPVKNKKGRLIPTVIRRPFQCKKIIDKG